MPHLKVTPGDFEERSNGTYFVGDLALAQQLARSDTIVTIDELTQHSGKAIVRMLNDGDPDNVSIWGCSESGDTEEAWRYLLGEYLGPYDFETPYHLFTWGETRMSEEFGVRLPNGQVWTCDNVEQAKITSRDVNQRLSACGSTERCEIVYRAVAIEPNDWAVVD